MSYWPPKYHHEQAYFYRFLGADNLEGRYESLEDIKPNVTPIDSVTEQVEYLIPFGFDYKVFKIESNDQNIQAYPFEEL